MKEGVVKKPASNFRGRSEHTLDQKGRLNIAARLREVLRSQFDERLMITPWKNYLRAYTLPQWEELEKALLAERKKQPGMINLIRYMIGGVVECSLDKQGRILLPPNLRADCGIDKDVVVNGMINYFEIWDKATWEEQNRPSEEHFDTMEQALFETGQY